MVKMRLPITTAELQGLEKVNLYVIIMFSFMVSSQPG